MEAVVFDIQRFSIDDGPGIRTVVFFKGCNMRCNWCHNPESLHPYAEMMFFVQKCIACGECFEVCEKSCHVFSGGEHFFDRDLCDNCGRCVAVCYAGALAVTGKSMTVGEVAAEIKKDDLFYQNS
ncbi:MAG TPA: 4Fe-4S binding protein, partial [Clostridia bacterium]|nr:4Fe-4S binding protein [Clostridia bacterium]